MEACILGEKMYFQCCQLQCDVSNISMDCRTDRGLPTAVGNVFQSALELGPIKET